MELFDDNVGRNSSEVRRSMFVQTNTLEAVQQYVKSSLAKHYSPSEIKQVTFQLLEHLFNLSRTESLLQKDLRFSETDLLKVRRAIKRLQGGEPLQYVLGDTEFCGLTLKVDKRALIPRPETEELVEEVIKRLNHKREDKLCVLDLCTGSGCIALGIKNRLPTCEVQGMDFSYDAVSLATENAKSTFLDVTFFQSDVFSEEFKSFLEKSNKWDAWTANPPYIPYKDKHEMHTNVLNFEPHVALFVSDENPLVFYAKISELAQNNVKKGGLLAFEVHENYAEKVVAIMESNCFQAVHIVKDLQGKNRMVLGENS